MLLVIDFVTSAIFVYFLLTYKRSMLMDEVRETGRRRKKNKNEMEKGIQKQQIERRSVVNEQMQKGDMEIKSA